MVTVSFLLPLIVVNLLRADAATLVSTAEDSRFVLFDEDTDKEQLAYQIINMVREQNPDVLCCQEFGAFKDKTSRKKCIDEFLQSAGFQYVYYNVKRNFGGNVVFSKYP